ncbi:nucleoside triphosphate pyrophosphohydrolase [Candidatus Fermentibacteria bacterium]|nr:MAG: nucleoside triphosphate pyrophosphohydrolase [Candidatus Fermentibacteria bacterium]
MPVSRHQTQRTLSIRTQLSPSCSWKPAREWVTAPYMDRTTEAINQLLKTVRTLRSPGGCNWDISQTLKTLRPYMLEEAYEVADAVDKDDMDDLKKELGDLLLHIVMAADICSEQNIFNMADVAEQITQKLIRRHPHVFDETSDLTPEQVEKQWEAIKAEEKKNLKKKFFDSIPAAMPALQKAWRIQQRASDVGFPFKTREQNTEAILDLLKKEDLTEETVGSILQLVSDMARQSGIEPEKALRDKNTDFIQRFNHLEELLEYKGYSLGNVEDEVLRQSIGIAFNGN